MSVFRGKRPDLTPAQVVGVLVAGIPVIVSLLRSFGVYDTDPEQQQALQDTVIWAGVLAGLLFASDAGLRASRNAADSRRDAAAVMSRAPVPPADSGTPPAAGTATDEAIAALLAPDSGTLPDSPEGAR